MIPHLLRCQGFAVAYYSFILGRLAAEAPSTFAHLGLKIMIFIKQWNGLGQIQLDRQIKSENGLLNGYIEKPRNLKIFRFSL